MANQRLISALKILKNRNDAKFLTGKITVELNKLSEFGC